MSIKLEGLDEVLNKITLFSDTSRIQQGLSKCCARVERSAKENAPKGRTGELKRSISSSVEGLEGTVFTPLEYAPYVEYGTGLFAENGGRSDVPWSYQDEQGIWHSTCGMEPQPFMRPALDENREEILKTMRESIIDD